MPTSPAKKSRAAEAARQRRERLRAQGLREVRMWVLDTRTPEFREEARRQMLAIANSAHAEEDQNFIDAISDPFTP